VVAAAVAVVAVIAGAVAPAVRYDPSAHTGEYSFIEKIDGQPVRWDPCLPIHYVVNLSNAPAGSLADVQDAVKTISAASGIRFVYDGPSNEMPDPDRRPFQPRRYPGRWAPVLIAWVDPVSGGFDFHKDSQGRDAIGIGGPIWSTSDPTVYVSGFVVLNDKQGYPEGFGGAYVQGATILHELGHVLGLGHVKAEGELMEYAGGGMGSFGPGDLQGLKLVGRPAGCLSEPPIP
jgi:hypothetical protein